MLQLETMGSLKRSMPFADLNSLGGNIDCTDDSSSESSLGDDGQLLDDTILSFLRETCHKRQRCCGVKVSKNPATAALEASLDEQLFGDFDLPTLSFSPKPAMKHHSFSRPCKELDSTHLSLVEVTCSLARLATESS